MPGRGVEKHLMLGEQQPLQPGAGLVIDRQKLRLDKIDAGAVHRAQHGVRNIGRPRIGKKMPPRFTANHVYYSHSIVPGGLLVMS